MKLRCLPPCPCYSWGCGMQADRFNWFKGWAHVHCVSLAANKLPLCFWVWFYAFCCCNDESTGKLCNDRGKPLLGEKKITLKRWGCQAASGHNASFCVSEKLATGTAGNGYSSPVIKTMDADHSDTNQWFNHRINETWFCWLWGIRARSPQFCAAFENGLAFLKGRTFPSSTFYFKTLLVTTLYQNILAHHIPLRLVFIDIYGSVWKFQWTNRAFAHSVYLGLWNLSLVAVLSLWGGS